MCSVDTFLGNFWLEIGILTLFFGTQAPLPLTVALRALDVQTYI